MSRNLQPKEEEEELELSMDSLIDVGFLLLIYFLVTTTLQETESDLEIKLPSVQPPTSAETPPVEDLPLTIAANGDVIKNAGQPNAAVLASGSNPSDLQRLRSEFEGYKALLEQAPDASGTVIISPDPEVSSQRFVDVVNQAVGADLENVSFTIFPDEEEGE